MRLLTTLCAFGAALTCAGTALADATPPDSGFLVFKDMRSYAVTEVRDDVTGKVITSNASFGKKNATDNPCTDGRHKVNGPYWHEFEPYLVNVASTPSHINRQDTFADLKAAHEAWEDPFTTDCPTPRRGSDYETIFGGKTTRIASLVARLESDGKNVASFQSLAGTVCDGALACVIIDYKGSKVREADLAIEEDLTRYGFEDYWTTDDTTWTDATGGRFAISDLATHEWGHFAGLDHVEKSPTLTMFPFIHDGAQTLGLGDMKGLLSRY